MWQQEEDDIFLEPTTCAVAFRLLRLHGYVVSSGSVTLICNIKLYVDERDQSKKLSSCVSFRCPKPIFRRQILQHPSGIFEGC